MSLLMMNKIRKRKIAEGRVTKQDQRLLGIANASGKWTATETDA
ncbi:MAG: hypothetical protein ABIU63_16700 [Chitinophagaceae bacterium]